MDYRKASRDELREELQRRDLPVAGTKDKLIQRLELDDRGEADETTERTAEDDNPGAFEPVSGPTRDEIREELQPRGLKTAGTKDELQTRLAEAKDAEEQETSGRKGGGESDADEEQDRQASGSGSQAGADGNGQRATEGELSATDAAALAVHQMSRLVAGQVAGVVGLERGEDGWQVIVEVVEIPADDIAEDVLGVYELALSGDGALHGYERTGRHARGEVDGGGSD